MGIGDFRLSPYRTYSPKCISSRIKEASFATRSIDPCNVIVAEGPPITRPERILVDPSLDFEGPSLIENAFYDVKAKGINAGRIETILGEQSNGKRIRDALSTIEYLMVEIQLIQWRNSKTIARHLPELRCGNEI